MTEEAADGPVDDAGAAGRAGCVLAPANTVERAVFFVLTGRPEAYQALDPDGTLLAAG